MTHSTVILNDTSHLILGRPDVRHGAGIRRLVGECKPLDINSTYAYLLLCEHFSDTCVHATYADRTVGFVSAYRRPLHDGVIFVWQVAVAEEMRGLGLGKSMLHELLMRPELQDCRALETTVSPSNTSSRALFSSLARDLGAHLTERPMFREQDFEGENHEAETLIHIGPFTATKETRQ